MQENLSQVTERSGDPFKDFDLELSRVSSEEAKIYIKMGRNATNSLISLQYRTDWSFEQKTNGVKIYHLTLVDNDKQYIRAECKFQNVSVNDMVECYQNVKKRN